MKYQPRNGLSVPTITVVDDGGRVIAEDQRRITRYVIQDGFGADIVFGNGTTGEWNRITNRERQHVIEITVDDVSNVNRLLSESGTRPVEAWVGINGSGRRETLDNLDQALHIGADAVVIAPLAIDDLNESDIVRFFLRDIADLIYSSRKDLPVFLYDNADIAAPGRSSHIRTRMVKELSRLEFIAGIKVSASRKVLGNYTKAALHFKQPGEFGIYIGNAMLIFDWYVPGSGFLGRIREGWRDYLLHDALPIGVVSGPGNAQPREWKKAWRACWSGDTERIAEYHRRFNHFEEMCGFSGASGYGRKTIACIKAALVMDGVISSPLVANGTRNLESTEATRFDAAWREYRQWASEDETHRSPVHDPAPLPK